MDIFTSEPPPATQGVSSPYFQHLDVGTCGSGCDGSGGGLENCTAVVRRVECQAPIVTAVTLDGKGFCWGIGVEAIMDFDVGDLIVQHDPSLLDFLDFDEPIHDLI